MVNLTEKMDLDNGTLYLEVENGTLTIDYGGDGSSSLSKEQLARLKEILNAIEIE